MLHEYLPKTRHMSQEDLMEWMPDNYPEDMICANCAHFAEAVPITVPLGGRLLERRLCLHAEFYGDAGQGSITLGRPGERLPWAQAPAPLLLPKAALPSCRLFPPGMTTACIPALIILLHYAAETKTRSSPDRESNAGHQALYHSRYEE